MGLFEDTVVKAKDVFDIAAKKTGEVVSVQKLKISLAQLNSQLSKEFETLGRLVYEQKNGCNADEAVNQTIAEIERKLDEISDLEKDISKARSEVECAACGAKCSADAAYCPKCGQKL